MTQFKATGKSIMEIQRVVRNIKKSLGLEKKLCFPIVEFAENILPTVFDNYTFEVASKEEMGNKHGETFPNEHIIKIREDIYIGAVEGNGRDRFTIAHEVGHLFLHDDKAISLCRLSKGKKLYPYEDPEWQANCFGGELLASAYLIRGMDEVDVANRCRVSIDAACTQLYRARML